jgi:hypothetical protein
MVCLALCLLEYIFVYFVAIPVGEQRTEPSTHFLEVVRQSVGMCHLFEKQYDQRVSPLVRFVCLFIFVV